MRDEKGYKDVEQVMVQMAVDASTSSVKSLDKHERWRIDIRRLNYFTNIPDYTKYREAGAILTLKEVIPAVCLDINGDPLIIGVRRSHLLKYSLKESRKAKFKPFKPLMVSEL